MALKGDTSNLLLADIFQTLSQNQQTGLLTLKLNDGVRRVLFTRQGITLYDARVFRAPRFAHLLVTGRVVPRNAVEAAIQGNEHLGSDPFSAVTLLNALAEAAAIDPQQGVRVLASEVREELFEVFAHPRMEFEFDESDVPVESVPRECLFRTEEIILDAARRVDEWQMIQDSLGDLDEFYVSRPNAKVEEQDRPVLQSLDGSRTIGDVAETLLRSRFEVARTVARLMSSDGVRLAGANELIEGAKKLDPGTQSTRIMRLLHRARSRMSKPDERLEEMAELYATSGLPSAAVSVLLDRAKALREQGHDEAAFPLVLRAREYDPENVRVLETLAELYESRGDTKAEFDVLSRLAERYAKSENYDDAILMGERIGSIFPDAPLLDQTFAFWCERAGKQTRGAEVLSLAVSQRAHPDRIAVLYEAILRLDPERSDIRKLLTGIRNAKKKSRTMLVIVVLVGLVSIVAIGHIVFVRMKEERLAGRYEAAAILVDKGEEQLAEAELQSILDAAGDGEIRNNAERLLGVIRSRLEDQRVERLNEQEQITRVELQAVQASIDAGEYDAAIERLVGLRGSIKEESLLRLHELKVKVLLARVEQEGSDMSRLAAAFTMPATDGAVRATLDAYEPLFSRARLAMYGRFAERVRALPGNSPERGLFEGPVEACLAHVEHLRPPLDEVALRQSRNDELEGLSDDYQMILDLLAKGDFARARDGLDRLLGDYGDGSLREHFEQQRAAADAAVSALDEIRALLAAGTVDAAHERARRAAAEIAAEDVDFATAVGFPVRVQTLPAGASLELDGTDIGRSPVDVWVKPESAHVVTAQAVGFEPMQVHVGDDSKPLVAVDLPRTPLFRLDLGATVDVTPAVSGVDLFVGARDGVVYRFDLREGARLATRSTGSLAGICAPPLLAGQSIIATAGEGVIHALDRATLAPIWQRALGGPLAGPPILAGDHVYAARTDGSVYQIAVATGDARQIAAVRGPLRSGPAVLGDVLAVGTTSGQVIGLSIRDGQVLFATPETTQPMVTLDAGVDSFLAADDAGLLQCLDRAGNVRWSRSGGAATAAPAVETDGLVLFAAGAKAFVLDARNGNVRAEVAIDGWIASPPALSGGRLYIGDRVGTLHVFDASTGVPVYRHAMHGELAARPLVLQEGVLVVARSGELAVLGS